MSRLRDVETTAEIKLALIADPHVGGLDIGIDTVNGIVFLTGFVQDRDQRGLAEEIARSHGGIDIKNDIAVLAEVPKELDARASPAPLGARDEEEDLAIRDRVLGAMSSDSRVNTFAVNVEACDGVVRLSGFQENVQARGRAEQITRRVHGVREVINEIEVLDGPEQDGDS